MITAKPDLYDHQETTAAFLHQVERALCTSDCGTGKTLSCLAAFDRAEGPKRMLVVAPLSILKPSWADDIEKFMPHLSWAIAHGPEKKRRKAFASNADIVIINHDGVKWLARNRELLDGFTHLVVDEFTAFKNRTAQRSGAMRTIADPFKYRWILSGTPNSNTITDLWHPVSLVDGGERLGKRFYAFRDQVQDQVQRGGFSEWHDKPGAIDGVSAMLADITIRFTLEECLDMPEHTVSERLLIPPPCLMEQYHQLQRHSVLDTDQGSITAIHASSRVKKMLQLLSGAVYNEEGTPLRVHQDRAALVMELVSERSQSVVAFNWQHELDTLKQLADKAGLPYGELHGNIKPKDRPAIVDAFQNGELRVLFCHPQSAGHGLTLTAATTTIWASPTYNAEHYKQFNHRIYRAGQHKRTETIRIAYEGTAEMDVFERLDGKVNSMEDLLSLFSTTLKQTA